MDGVALASVITSGVAVIATSGVAVWSVRQSAKLARETRTQQRLAESYLEVLRIVVREGQWVEATITNWEMAAEEAELGHGGVGREKVSPEPAVTDRATIAAHLAAFGSDNVRTRYKAWRSIIEDFEIDAAMVKLYPDSPPPTYRAGQPKRFLELRARKALADAIAVELGVRDPAPIPTPPLPDPWQEPIIRRKQQQKKKKKFFVRKNSS